MKDDNDECERCCDWSNIQPFSYHRPALQVAVAFRLCRTKQNPDSSPPGGAERIQYDTDCEAFHGNNAATVNTHSCLGTSSRNLQSNVRKCKPPDIKQQAVSTDTQYQNIEHILFKI